MYYCISMKCNVCLEKTNKLNYIFELEFFICNICFIKYNFLICLKCNNKIFDKDFVSDCFCKNCFNKYYDY